MEEKLIKNESIIQDMAIVYIVNEKPGFEFIYFDATKNIVETKSVAIDPSQIANGLPLHTMNLNNLLNPYIPSNVKQATVLLDSSNIYKTTFVFPKVNFFKTMKLYANELKSTQGDAKDKYKTIMQEYKGHSSNIFYTYFIPTNLNVFAIKLTRTLGLKLKGIDLYANWLLANLKESVPGDVMYLYAHEDRYTLIASFGGVLSSYVTFDKDEKQIDANVYGYGMKHIYELEKVGVDCVYTNDEKATCNILEAKYMPIEIKGK